MTSIILMSIALMSYTSRGFRFFMAEGAQGTEHVWLVMMKAMRALTRYAAAGIEETGLGLSDFGVLELLLHKGPLPVNTIGPIVNLTPGSISIPLVARLGCRPPERVVVVPDDVGGGPGQWCQVVDGADLGHSFPVALLALDRKSG